MTLWCAGGMAVRLTVVLAGVPAQSAAKECFFICPLAEGVAIDGGTYVISARPCERRRDVLYSKR